MTVNDASGEDRRVVRTENPNEFYVMLRPASTDPGLEIGSSDEEKLEIGSWAEEMLERGLKEANDDLRGKGSGWRLESEPGPEHRIVVPVKVTHPPQLTATRVTMGLTDLSDELHRLTTPIEMVVDPLIFRFPGHKPTFSAFGLSAPPLGADSPDGDIGRVPVAVLADPPGRASCDMLPGSRRRVVALLDTKLERHDWLGEPGTALGGDAFWVDAITTKHPWVPGPRLDPEPERRELGVYEGHGTFCAGLIRQMAPDAQVLALHVARDHNRHVYGDHILNALSWLHYAGLVPGDVVCLPSGFKPVPGVDNKYLALLRRALARLIEDGVRVVAAAGNQACSELIYPAAFASTDVPDGLRLASVGAYNTDGKTPAHFSNHGTWVTRWEIGTGVVSTFPAVDKAATPKLTAEPDGADPAGFPGRTTADPDDFTRRKPAGAHDPTGPTPADQDELPVWELAEEVELTAGFARWSGTSFAAAVHAARLARKPVPPSAEAAAPAHVVR